MEGLNEVILLGTVGAQPEVNVISDTMRVTKLRLATNESFKDKQGVKKTNTEWHSLEAWGYTSDLIGKYVKKGDNLLVRGKIKYESYDDKNNPGMKKYSTKIVVDKITFIPSNNGENQQGQQGQQGQQQPMQQQQQQPMQQQPMQQQQQPMQQQPIQQQPIQQQPIQQQPIQQQVNEYVQDNEFMEGLKKTGSPDDLPF